MEGDLDVGMNEDDLLGDFGDDFNILEFADALDGNDTKTNILDDLEAEDTKEGEKEDAGPPPYNPPQGPPPPYPGPHKVSHCSACVSRRHRSGSFLNSGLHVSSVAFFILIFQYI